MWEYVNNDPVGSDVPMLSFADGNPEAETSLLDAEDAVAGSAQAPLLEHDGREGHTTDRAQVERQQHFSRASRSTWRDSWLWRQIVPPGKLSTFRAVYVPCVISRAAKVLGRQGAAGMTFYCAGWLG